MGESNMHGGIGILADDGEKVQCHICGKWFRCLGMHVNRKHELNGEEYKERFGLNRTQSLSSGSYNSQIRETNKEVLKALVERNKLYLTDKSKEQRISAKKGKRT